MRAQIIKIGNSQGIRIPKAVLKQTGLGEQVEILVEDDHPIIAPVEPKDRAPRAGWAKAISEMAARGDDALLDGDAALPDQ